MYSNPNENKMYIDEYRGKSFSHSTNDHVIALSINELEQNSEEKDVWRFKLTIDGKDVTKTLFKNNNLLNFHLEYFQFITDNSKYAFIPLEGAPVLMDLNSLEFVNLPYVEKSTETFLANCSTEEYHMTSYHHVIFVTDLETLKSITINLPDKVIMYPAFYNDKQILIEYYDKETKETKTISYDIPSEKFINK